MIPGRFLDTSAPRGARRTLGGRARHGAKRPGRRAAIAASMGVSGGILRTPQTGLTRPNLAAPRCHNPLLGLLQSLLPLQPALPGGARRHGSPDKAELKALPRSTLRLDLDVPLPVDAADERVRVARHRSDDRRSMPPQPPRKAAAARTVTPRPPPFQTKIFSHASPS